jgi:hypothetical protein
MTHPGSAQVHPTLFHHLHLISSALLDLDVLLRYLRLNPSVFLAASQVQTVAPPSPDRLPATSRCDFQPLATVDPVMRLQVCPRHLPMKPDCQINTPDHANAPPP